MIGAERTFRDRPGFLESLGLSWDNRVFPVFLFRPPIFSFSIVWIDLAMSTDDDGAIQYDIAGAQRPDLVERSGVCG
jgi:hypothetical protein